MKDNFNKDFNKDFDKTFNTMFKFGIAATILNLLLGLAIIGGIIFVIMKIFG